MVQVNEPIAPDDPLYADLALEDRPKWRSIAAANLFKVGTVDSRNCP